MCLGFVFCYVSGELDGNRRVYPVYLCRPSVCARHLACSFFVSRFVLSFLMFHRLSRFTANTWVHVCVCVRHLAKRLCGTSKLNGTIVFRVVKFRAAG